MAVLLKIEDAVTIEVTADQFLDVLKNQQLKLPLFAPGLILHVEECDGFYVWKIIIGGRVEFYKLKVEVDEEKNIARLVIVEGDIFDIYKVYKPIFYAEPREEGCWVKSAIEFEKVMNDYVPVPLLHSNLHVGVVKDIGRALSNKA